MRTEFIHNVRTKNNSKQLSEVTDLVQLNFRRENGTALPKLIDLYFLDRAKKRKKSADEMGGLVKPPLAHVVTGEPQPKRMRGGVSYQALSLT